MGAFDEAIAVRPAGEGRYEIHPDERFAIAGAVNGGVLLANILRAVLDSSPHPYPIATSAHFLRAPRPEPAHVDVDWLKHGKVAATARATLVQGGRPMLETTVTTGALGDPDDVGGLSWTGEPPHLPPIEKCHDIQDAQGPRVFSGYARQVDIRLDPATLGWTRGEPSGIPEMRGYFQLREPREPDAYLLAHGRADLVHAGRPGPRRTPGGGPVPARQRRLVRRGSRGLGQRGPAGRAEPPARPGRPVLTALARPGREPPSG